MARVTFLAVHGKEPVPPALIAPRVGLLAVPLGYAAGMAVKVVLLALFLWPRVRAIGRPEPSALISPGSAPAGSGRA